MSNYPTFQQAFLARLDDIERRGRACTPPLSLTSICKASGVARATPDRWRAKPPKSVALMDQLEAVVIAAEKQVAQA